jgi:hypothetical protein
MANVSEDTKLSVLNDHYKETVADFKKTGKSRDSNFLAMMILVGVMAFQFVSPSQSQSVLTQIAHEKLGVNATLSVNFFGSLIWFALLYVAIRYFQAVINLEKQYNYSHELEELLSQHYGGKAFTREGKAYLKDYPIYSDWVHIVYRTIFPALLLAVVTIKLLGEWFAHVRSALPLALDTVIYAMLVVSIVLYVYSLHKTEKHDETDIDA